MGSYNNNIKLTKQQTKVINDLYSCDENKILDSIKILREAGGEYSVAPLMDVFFTTPYIEVQKSIGNLICDIKDNKISDIITQNLSKYSENKHIGLFLSKLWQSSLKFNDLTAFVDIFLKGDDNTAFESYTIIEQNISYITDNYKNIIIELMRKNIDSLGCFKRNLADDILEL